MKFTLTAALAATTYATELADQPAYTVYEDDHDYYGHVPTGNYWEQVDDFNPWHTIRDQGDYEERLHTEAELMIALEALREALVVLDMDIDELYYGIGQNDDHCHDNDSEID